MAKEERTTLNVRGIKVPVARAIRAAATARGLTVGDYLETLMPHVTRDLRTVADEGGKAARWPVR